MIKESEMGEANASDRNVLLDIYKRARLVYQADAKFHQIISSGKLRIIYYSPRGQEVVSAAKLAANDRPGRRRPIVLQATWRRVRCPVAAVPAAACCSLISWSGLSQCRAGHVQRPLSGLVCPTLEGC